MVFLADGRLVSACYGAALRVWDLRTGGSQTCFGVRHRGGCIVSPAGTLAFFRTVRRVELRDLAGNPREIACDCAPYPTWLGLSPSGRLLLLGGNPNLVVDLSTPGAEPRPWLAGRPVYQAAFSAEGQTLFALDFERHLWRLDHAGGPPVELPWDPRMVWGQEEDEYYDGPYILLTCSPDGRHLAVAVTLPTGESALRVCHPAMGEWWGLPLGWLHAGVTSLGFAPDNRTVGAVLADGQLLFWDAVRRREGPCLLWQVPLSRALAFAPDGHTLAVSAHDGSIRLLPWRRLLE
jgi:WD40 repeat protein